VSQRRMYRGLQLVCALLRIVAAVAVPLICGVLNTPQILAQSPQTTGASLPSFEVASIRPNPGPFQTLRGYSSSGPMLNLEAYTIADLIEEAYDLKDYQVALPESSARPIVYGTYYNIAAKAEGDGTPTRGEFRPMLQTLLDKRFNLKFHHEMKEMPVYALVVGKNGPKFKESAPDAAFSSYHGVNGRNQNMTLVKTTMESLAGDISGSFAVNRPIVNETGLTGTYDIKLEATPEGRLTRSSEPGDISVFTAVQEQLGLKLESAKRPVKVLVIDHVEEPSEN
jgi:uncharacterized protein (TIGR03435 family)